MSCLPFKTSTSQKYFHASPVKYIHPTRWVTQGRMPPNDQGQIALSRDLIRLLVSPG